MSRSYKKTPYCGDKKGKDKKRLANHAVRQKLKTQEIGNNNCYKKLYDSYDICDYYFLMSFEEFWKMELETYFYFLKHSIKRDFPNKQEAYKKWKKSFKNK